MGAAVNEAGFAEWECPPGTVEANGRAEEPHPYADPTMTREARIAWRLEHLDEWQRDIESLDHYDPGYAYDVAHEYDVDWTTDPDYGPEGIHLYEFDEDGVPYPDDDRPLAIRVRMRDTARDRLGHRVVYQTRYGFVPEIAERVGLRTRQGYPSNTVKPDLIVMPSEEDLDPSRFLEDGQPRPDDAVPELVLEILSESTAVRDQEGKRRLYEYLGAASTCCMTWAAGAGTIRCGNCWCTSWKAMPTGRFRPTPGCPNHRHRPSGAAYSTHTFVCCRTHRRTPRSFARCRQGAGHRRSFSGGALYRTAGATARATSGIASVRKAKTKAGQKNGWKRPLTRCANSWGRNWRMCIWTGSS